MNTEKLQKVISAHGLTSRRQAEAWIKDGRVSVNGRIVGIGTRVGENDVIRVDGRIINKVSQQSRIRVLLYHKVEGEISSRVKEKGLDTVFTTLPRIKNGRWIAVGRLDVQTSGLMLFTNNGDLAHYLMHPRHQMQRSYAVRVLGEVTEATLKQLKQGVMLEDGPAAFESIVDKGGTGANHWFEVTLKEGRNREVRRLWEAVGLQVTRLIRIGFGPISLPRNLRRGRWKELTKPEVQQFLNGIEFKTTIKKTAKAVKKANRRRGR